MKKILIIASLALCCSLLASCEDFLDTKKYGAKTDWETQEDVEKALVALFSFNTNDSEGVTGRCSSAPPPSAGSDSSSARCSSSSCSSPPGPSPADIICIPFIPSTGTRSAPCSSAAPSPPTTPKCIAQTYRSKSRPPGRLFFCPISPIRRSPRAASSVSASELRTKNRRRR